MYIEYCIVSTCLFKTPAYVEVCDELKPPSTKVSSSHSSLKNLVLFGFIRPIAKSIFVQVFLVAKCNVMTRRSIDPKDVVIQS